MLSGLLAEETTRSDRGSEEARIALLRLVLIELGAHLGSPRPLASCRR